MAPLSSEAAAASNSRKLACMVTSSFVRSEIIVDINAKCEGVVPEYDLEKLSPDDRSALRVGGEVLVFVVNPEDANGNIVLSLSRAQSAHDWVESRRLLESQEIVELEVASCNKGGLIVYVGQLRGFVQARTFLPRASPPGLKTAQATRIAGLHR